MVIMVVVVVLVLVIVVVVILINSPGTVVLNLLGISVAVELVPGEGDVTLVTVNGEFVAGK